jgi:hypothetical protein
VLRVAGAESTRYVTAAAEAVFIADVKLILFNSDFVAYVEDAEIWVRYILEAFNCVKYVEEAELLVKYVDKSVVADAISTHSVFSLFLTYSFLAIIL